MTKRHIDLRPKKDRKPPAKSKINLAAVSTLDREFSEAVEKIENRIEKEIESSREVDEELPPNWPRGMRAVDYNAAREAQVMEEALCNRGVSGSDDNSYAEPAVPFKISTDKVPLGNPRHNLWSGRRAKEKK